MVEILNAYEVGVYMRDQGSVCKGWAVVNGTMRFLGSISRNVCEGFFFFLPFMRPGKIDKSFESPSAPQEPAVIPQRQEHVRPPKSEAVHKVDSEVKKASPIEAILSAIKPSGHGHVEEQHPRREASTIEFDDFLKGIPFQDAGEAMRAEVYVKDFSSGSPKMRREALAQVETLPRPAAVEILKRLMDGQKDTLVQMEILDSMAALNADGTLDKRLFKDYLRSENSILRLAAVRAFSKYKDEESLNILTSATHDSDPEIRKRALSSILTSFEKNAVPLAMRALNDTDANVRKTAVSICGILRVKQAISQLISMLGDAEKEVQRAANDALKKITGEDFDFNSGGSLGNKKEAMEAWRFWWRDHQTSFGMNSVSRAS